MLRPIAAGLMCLTVVTLGVAATWGQDEVETPQKGDAVIVEDVGQVPPAAGGGPIKEGDVKTVEISIGTDGAAVVTEREPRRVEVREDGLYVINEKDGSIVLRQEVQANPQYGGIPARARLMGAPVADPGAREALEKLIAGLKDEVKRLEADGKKEEAERKQQSIRALEPLLNPAPRWGVSARQRVNDAMVFGRNSGVIEAGPAAEEFRKLRERIQELNEQMSKAAQEDRPKIEQEMAEVHKKFAEQHQRRIAVLPGAGMVPPGFPGAPGGLPIAVPAPGMPGGMVPHGPMGEADILAHRAHALRQAAEQLKQAGLNEQAGELAKQAEKLQAEFEKTRAHAADVVYFAGRQPVELHRSIRELQEQVQQLRKEVAELRELLQRRQ